MDNSNLVVKTNSLLLMLGLAALIIGVRLHLIGAYSISAPYYDDYGMGGKIILYETGEWTLSGFFHAWNGHMVTWSKLLNFALFEANEEQWDTQLVMILNALIWTSGGLILVTIARRHFQSVSVPVFTCFVVALWLFPTSLINATWAVLTHNYLMIVLAVAAIWLTTTDQWSRSWWWGWFFAFASTLTMGGGAFVSLAIFGVALTQTILAKSGTRAKYKPTLVVGALLSTFSLFILWHSSGDAHSPYVASGLTDYFTTFFKTLSFPLTESVLPSLVWLLPIVTLGIKAIVNGDLDNRVIRFTLTLFAFTLGIAVAIGYARGLYGQPPAPRYYEFLQLYFLVSLLALLILQTKEYALRPWANSILVIAWAILALAGATKQINHLAQTVQAVESDKPQQQDAARTYLATKDIADLRRRPLNHLPFPGPDGLALCLNETGKIDMIHHELQVLPPLVTQNTNTVFIRNGTFRPSSNEYGYNYQYEDVVGSYHALRGGVAATGEFVSQLIDTRRSYLMIPVTGYLGFPDTLLKLVDEHTGEETIVTPESPTSTNAERWQRIYVKAPENPFRVVAIDNNPKLWFGFAAPRNVGRLSMLTRWLMNNGVYFWQFGLLLIVLSLRSHIIAAIRRP